MFIDRHHVMRREQLDVPTESVHHNSLKYIDVVRETAKTPDAKSCSVKSRRRETPALSEGKGKWKRSSPKGVFFYMSESLAANRV